MNNQFIDNVKDALKIENTRLLFDFFAEFDKSISMPHIDDGKLFTDSDSLGKAFSETKESLLKIVQNASSSDKLLYQNYMSKYIKFLVDLIGEALSDDILNKIVYLYMYFYILRYLESKRENYLSNELDRRLPYIYETLCDIICEFTKCDMCYMVYKNGNNLPQLFAQSGEAQDIYNTDKFDELLRGDKVKKDIKNSWGGYAISDKYCVIELRPNEIGSKERFYIILNNMDDSHVKVNTPLSIVFILTMRRSLTEALSLDYAKLLNYKNDYSYVVKYSDSQNSGARLLHISDLHVGGRDDDGKVLNWQDTNKSSNNSNNYALANLLEEIDKTKTRYDLLVVTGDIVQGNGDAVEIRENYEQAGKALKEIAQRLWGYKYSNNSASRLPHDWKKRIIITTGNHDYAMMNDLKSVRDGRQTIVATPTKRVSGAIIKQTYFIEFILKFFDCPVEQYIQDELNEIRDYKELDLSLFVINSSSRTNVSQNNAVGISDKILKKLIDRFADLKNKYSVCLLHHTPKYVEELDYYDDRTGYKWWMEKFDEDNDLKDISELIEMYMGVSKLLLANPQDENLESKKKDFKDKYDNNQEFLEACMYYPEPKYKRFYPICFVISKLRKFIDNSSDEIITDNEFLSEIAVDESKSMLDKKAYSETYHQFEKSNIAFDAIMGGHIHNNMFNGQKEYEGNSINNGEEIKADCRKNADIICGRACNTFAECRLDGEKIKVRFHKF